MAGQTSPADIFLTEDQIALRESARVFAQKEIEPIATKIDLDEHTPDSLIKAASEFGLFGLFTPVEYGGAGVDLTSVCLVTEEIAKASPAFAGSVTVQMVLCPTTVAILGAEEQKQRFLPASASGERLIAYSQSEPGGAANVMSHLTRLTPDADGKGWRLNGSKLFCTQSAAKNYLLMVRTTDREGKEGFGCVMVEAEMPGFTILPYENKLGWRGTNTGPLSFDDVYIPPENVLGSLADAVFSHRRANHANVIAHAASSLGCAQGMLDKTVVQVQERQLYGRGMAALQPVSYWLAESHAKIEACRALVYHAARCFDAGVMPDALPNVCKAYVGDTAFDICAKLLSLWGGSGIMNSTGINRYMRDAKAKTIAEGSSEIHYAIIANGLLYGRPTLVPPELAS